MGWKNKYDTSAWIYINNTFKKNLPDVYKMFPNAQNQQKRLVYCYKAKNKKSESGCAKNISQLCYQSLAVPVENNTSETGARFTNPSATPSNTENDSSSALYCNRKYNYIKHSLCKADGYSIKTK